MEFTPYRKRPVIVLALRYDGDPDNLPLEVRARSELRTGAVANGLYIATSEGHMRCNKGDWIIRGVEGEFYPCAPSVFEKTYDEVTD